MSRNKFKQVIVVREDIDMSVGKLAAQVAHASLSSYERCKEDRPEWAKDWLKDNQKKVVCMVEDLSKLEELVEKAEKEGIPFYVVIDMGLTEVPPTTTTCVGFGPAPEREIDRVTGMLKLLH